MATHSSILAYKIPWTEEPNRLQSMGSQRVRHDGATLLTYLLCLFLLYKPSRNNLLFAFLESYLKCGRKHIVFLVKIQIIKFVLLSTCMSLELQLWSTVISIETM